MSERRAVTKKLALSYRAGDRARKSRILDEVVELTGWHRDYARAVLRDAAKQVRPVTPRASRKNHDRGQTPHQRAVTDPNVRKLPIIRMNAQFKRIHPAATSRQILALTGSLETIALAKRPVPAKPAIRSAWNARRHAEIPS